MADAPAVPEKEPVPAPAPEPAPAPQPDPAPQPEPAPQPDSAPAAEAAPERTPSLLETAEAPGQKENEAAAAGDKPAEPPKEGDQPKDAKAEEKPEEPAKEGDQPKPEEAKAEEKAAEPPALEPVEYEYTVPEQIVMDDARRGQFKEALDGFRADPKAGAQKLLDMHTEALVAHDKAVRQQQWDVFNETKKGWRDQVLADEMIGGAGHRTAMTAIATARNAFVSDHPFGSKEYKADVAEFVNALDSTGAGDHPAILKFIYRVARRMNEPAAPHVLDLKPAPDAHRRKGGDTLYDNDRSPRSGPQ